MILGIIYISTITESADAVLNQTARFKYVDWFTKIKTKVVNRSAFYLLAIVFIAVTLYVGGYLRIK